MKIVVGGASGLVGRALTTELVAHGHEVVVLSRHPVTAQRALPRGARAVGWNGTGVQPGWAAELSGAGAVVNLSGASIGTRPWTPGRRREIVRSRAGTNRMLVAAIGRTAPESRPRVFVTASGIDYYGDRGDEPVTEETGPGDSFLARVCVEWEAAAAEVELLGLRVVAIRTAFVLARGAPALRLLTLPFRLFVGGPLGDGRQWFSWIHIDDLVRLYRLAIEDERVNGPVNAAAPSAVRQEELARTVGHVLRRPARFRTPAWLIRLILRDQADLLLHGRLARPERVIAAGHEFRFPTLEPALEDVLEDRRVEAQP